MSSTTGVQNLLVNVFRPAYVYDPTATLYAVKLDISNVNTFYGNNVDALWANIGDSGNNVYVGRLAGNDPTVTLKNCSNNTAVGYAAGSNISNVQNSTYIGYSAGAGAASTSNTIAIGAGAYGNGNSNIYIGNSAGSNGSTSSNNILIGHSVAPGNVSYQMRLGYSSNITLAGDLSRNWVGIGRTAPSDTYVKLDVSGDTRVQGNLGLNITPGTRTLDVNGNFRAQDASMNALDFSNGYTTSTGGYVSKQSNISIVGTGESTIGSIKKGIINVSAIDQTNSANRAATVYFAWTASNVTSLSAVSNGDLTITTSGSNLRLSNASVDELVFDYSITYFPLP